MVLRALPPCGRRSSGTAPKAARCRPRRGHHARTPIAGRSWSCHGPAPAPAQACRQHAAWRLGVSLSPTPRPAAAAGRSCCLPSPPASSAPAPRPPGRRSRSADTTADDRHTWPPARGRAGRGPPGRGRSAATGLRFARYDRSASTPASAERAGLLGSSLARTPASPRRLHPAAASGRRSPGTCRLPRERSPRAADDRAAAAAPLGRRCAAVRLLRGVLTSSLPGPRVAAPTARSRARSSPMSGRTVPGAAKSAALSAAR